MKLRYLLLLALIFSVHRTGSCAQKTISPPDLANLLDVTPTPIDANQEKDFDFFCTQIGCLIDESQSEEADVSHDHALEHLESLADQAEAILTEYQCSISPELEKCKKKWSLKKKILVALAATGGVALIAGLIWYFIQKKNSADSSNNLPEIHHLEELFSPEEIQELPPLILGEPSDPQTAQQLLNTLKKENRNRKIKNFFSHCRIKFPHRKQKPTPEEINRIRAKYYHPS